MREASWSYKQNPTAEHTVEMQTPAKFASGDKVRRKGGGPVMTVGAARDHVADCTWYSNDRLAQGTFDQRDLELVRGEHAEDFNSKGPGKELLFREWQAANRKAHAKETEIARACLAALERNADWPSDKLRVEAQKVRALADDLFKVAMAQIDDRARLNRQA